MPKGKKLVLQAGKKLLKWLRARALTALTAFVLIEGAFALYSIPKSIAQRQNYFLQGNRAALTALYLLPEKVAFYAKQHDIAELRAAFANPKTAHNLEQLLRSDSSDFLTEIPALLTLDKDGTGPYIRAYPCTQTLNKSYCLWLLSNKARPREIYNFVKSRQRDIEAILQINGDRQWLECALEKLQSGSPEAADQFVSLFIEMSDNCVLLDLDHNLRYLSELFGKLRGRPLGFGHWHLLAGGPSQADINSSYKFHQFVFERQPRKAYYIYKGQQFEIEIKNF